MSLLELIGIAGALIVSVSNLPQMVLFIRNGHAKGISHSSTWVGLVGVLFRTIYLLGTVGTNFTILGPYYFAIACILLTLYYLYYPRKTK